ncbi:hypothetical protein K1719_042761 [Acacia pycnantha]|nr:hypothetical protein K1719_042761 [Acacia pycnantha]
MHEDFSKFIKSNWVVDVDWCESVCSFFENLKKWNKEVFGNPCYMKEQLYHRIYGINAKITSIGPLEYLEKIRSNLWCELEKILSREEVMWLHSWATWYKQGDCNMRYFHSMANG